MRNGLPFASHVGLRVSAGAMRLEVLGSGSFVLNPASLASTSVEEVITPQAPDLDLTVK